MKKLFWCKNCVTMSSRPRITFDERGFWWERFKKGVSWVRSILILILHSPTLPPLTLRIQPLTFTSFIHSCMLRSPLDRLSFSVRGHQLCLFCHCLCLSADGGACTRGSRAPWWVVLSWKSRLSSFAQTTLRPHLAFISFHRRLQHARRQGGEG